MAKLTTLKDKQGNTLYPLTKTNAVSDSNGTSLDSLLSAINQNKQDTLTFDITPTQNSTNPVTSGGVYNALAQHGKVKVYQNQPVGNLSKSVTIDASIKPTMIMFEAKTSGGNVVIKTMPYEVAKGWNYDLFMHDNRDCYLTTSVFNLTESVSGNNKTITITYTQASQGGFTANSLGCWLVW